MGQRYMETKQKNVLITGVPGIGKTTIIRQLAGELESLRPVGFFTEEIRETGSRVGFALAGLDGERRVLSHLNVRSRYHVGKYGVDLEAFEAFLGNRRLCDPGNRLVIIDEIGKMECLSPLFRQEIIGILNSEIVCIATIARKGNEFIESIKERPDVILFEVTLKNRSMIAATILDRIQSLFL
jgi:nucleoside-triphosphatase